MRGSTDKYSLKSEPPCGMVIRMMRRGIMSIPCALLVTLCLLSLPLAQVLPTTSEPCPIPPSAIPDREHQLAFGKIPIVLKPGTQIDVQISPELTGEQITALCFDTFNAPPVHSQSTFPLTIPLANAAAPQQSWPPGDHTVTVVLNDKFVIRQTLRTAPRLDSVLAQEMQRGDPTFRVVFKGDGFDVSTRTNNSIHMVLGGGVSVDQNVCWTDADCNAKGTKIRGEVTSPQQISVSHLDPADERNYAFKVCVSGVCTDGVADKSTQYLWLVPAISCVIALAFAGVVVLLTWQLRPVFIEGKQYLISALFLDKETNTYSLSKLQFYVWTFVAAFGYIDLIISRNFYQNFTGLPPVPAGLPGIVAIAAGTAVGAQVITGINGPKGAGQTKPSLADFVTTGDVVAAERVQFFVWTLVGALAFFVIIWVADPRAMTDLPEVPWSLLSISGLSAFGYLGGKLARHAGPVILEITAHKGPDPASPPLAPQAPAPAIADARNKLAEARTAFQQVASSPAVQPALDAANKAWAAAEQAISAAAAGQAAQAKKSSDDATASATAAETAAQQLQAGTSDRDNALKAADAARKAAEAAQAASSALANVTPPQPPSSQPSDFGLLEIRGRTLSRDATFRVSPKADPQVPQVPDLDISFDLLQPEPNDPNKIKKPRIIELDPDAKDPTVAKRLLLVINIPDAKLAAIFIEKSVHTLTITNPDSQKAMLQFTVPESQKPS